MARKRALLLFFFGSLLIRTPAILYPPATFFYQSDAGWPWVAEAEFTFGVLDHFLGVPSTTLKWPGTTLDLLFLPVITTQLLIRAVPAHSAPEFLKHFVTAVSEAYSDPHRYVTALRFLVALIASFASCLVFLIARKMKAALWASLLLGVLISVHPLFYRCSVMAVADALSITFALASFLSLLLEKPGKSGILFAAATASRVTVLSLIVLPFVWLLLTGSDRTLRERFSRLRWFGVGFALAFPALCPYIWTDPIRFAKTVIGNVYQAGSEASWNVFGQTWLAGMGLTFTILTLIILGCSLYLLRYRTARKDLSAVLLTLIMVVIPLYVHATITHPRYYLPIVPCVLLLGILISKHERVSFRANKPNVQSGMVLLCVAVLLTMTAETAWSAIQIRLYDDFEDGLRVMNNLPADVVRIVPETAVDRFILPLPKPVLQAQWEVLRRRQADRMQLNAFLKLRGIPQEAADVFEWSFNEDEVVAVARTGAMLVTASASAPGVVLYGQPGGSVDARISRASIDLEEAKREIRSGKSTAAILLSSPDQTLGTPLWRGRQEWYCYLQKQDNPRFSQ